VWAVQSYCYEWLPAMLRDAALLTLDLCIHLAEHEMTLQDGHPWNVLFDGPKPGNTSMPAQSSSARDDILVGALSAVLQFFSHFLCTIYAADRDHIARWLMRDYLGGVGDGDLLAALPASFKLRHPQRTLGVAIPKVVGKLFEHLPDDVQQRFLSLSQICQQRARPGKTQAQVF
jgi:hypothetical protein